MHELSVCRSLLRQVQAIAAPRDAQVRRVTLRIGPLAGVDADLLSRAWPLATEGTAADGAALIVETTPLRVHCRTCGVDSNASLNRLSCAACGDWHTDLLSGDEMLLCGVELEEPEPVMCDELGRDRGAEAAMRGPPMRAAPAMREEPGHV